MPTNGKVTIDILEEGKTKLHSFSEEGIKGFNYVDYDLSISEKTVKNDFSKKEIKVEKATNEKYCLPKGTYLVKVTNGKYSLEQKLEIK